MSRKAGIIVLLGVVGVSFSAIFVKFSTAPSAVLAFYRMLFSAVLLLPVVWLRYRDELRALTKENIVLCMISGFFLACHFACYFESIVQTSVASSTVLVDTEVFFVCIFSFLLFHEKSSRLGLCGIVITFLGSVVLALTDRTASGNELFGDFLALCGAVFVCVYTMVGSRVRKNVTTTLYTFLVYGTAAIVLFFYNVFCGQSLVGYGKENYLLGLLLCVFCTFLGHSIFNWGLKYLPAALISNMKLGEPVFATILAYFLFKQVPSVQQLIGGGFVLLGIYTYLYGEQHRIENNKNQ